MDAKLTLSIRPDVIVRAKAWARQEGKSLSAAVEEYLDNVTQQHGQKKTPLEIIRELTKSLPKLTDEEYAQRKHDHLTKKYGGR